MYGLVLIKAYCHGTKAKTVELSYISYDNNGFCSIHIILASLRPEGLIRGYEVEARRDSLIHMVRLNFVIVSNMNM